MQITDFLSRLTDIELRNLVHEAIEEVGMDSAQGTSINDLLARLERDCDLRGGSPMDSIETLICREAARRFLLAGTSTNKSKTPRPKNPTPRVIESLTLPKRWTYRRYWKHHNIEILSRPGGGEVTVDFDRRLFTLGATRPSQRTDKSYGGNAWKKNLLKDAIEALEAEQQAYGAMLGKR